MDDDFLITIDIDWAPDWMINFVATVLIKKRVKATWFVTHASPAIESIRERPDLFELGIHPNCMPGSTHGSTEDDVLRHVKQLVPDAISMRTHGLYQSTRFLAKAALQHGIFVDVSLFLKKTPNLVRHRLNWQGSGLWRVPYFWEDDIEMFEEEPIWSLSDPGLHVAGLKVFDFHPAYICLNTDTFGVYESLKHKKPLPTWDREFVASHAVETAGPKTMFLELVDHLASSTGGKWVKELVPHKNPGVQEL